MPRIQVLLDGTQLTPNISECLQQLNAELQVLPLQTPVRTHETGDIDARLVITHDAQTLTNGRLKHLLAWVDCNPCATLVVSQTPLSTNPKPTLGLGNRAIDFVSDHSLDDLAGRLSAMCGLRKSFDALRGELEALKRHDEELMGSLRQLQEELRLAGLIQRDLFRSNAGEIEGASVHILHRPAGEVSGDVHVVQRLDSSRVAVTVADATGHGLSAALLSVFIQRALRESMRPHHDSKHRSPAETLADLNREILAAELEECHFLTAVYAIYDEDTRVLEFARGGAPYPILARSGRPWQPILCKGPMLGVSDDAVFESVRLELEPGDLFLIHTDGMDTLTPTPTNPILSENRDEPSWLRELLSGPIDRRLFALEQRLQSQVGNHPRSDDVTILALQVAATALVNNFPRNPRPTRVEQPASL
ncbi:MAG: PP2C family protein-serine/threonine phosphatase [Planctomycetota bacterium]